jgi:hypothetical protein
MRNSHQPACDTTEHGRRIAEKTPLTVFSTGQPQPPSDKESWIGRALSWLASCMIEGFAAYGESICPCLHDLPEHYGVEGDKLPSQTSSRPSAQENPWSQPARLSRDVDIYAWLASSPSPSPRTRHRWLRFVAIWPKRPAVARTESSCNGLDMPDDRALRDGGVESHEIGPARHRFASFR